MALKNENQKRLTTQDIKAIDNMLRKHDSEYPKPVFPTESTRDMQLRLNNELLKEMERDHPNLNIVKRALQSGADPNTRDGEARTVLMIAAKFNDVEIAKLLIDKGADVNAMDFEKKTVVMYASEGGGIKIAEMLLDRLADPNVQSDVGMTALMFASMEDRRIGVVKLLIANGNLIDRQNNDGETALMIAANRGAIKNVGLLIDHGADIHAIGYDEERTQFTSVLMEGVIGMKKEVVSLLLERGVDINYRDDNGNTALIWAVTQRDAAIVKILVDNKADVNIINSRGNTALSIAKTNAVYKIIEILENQPAK